ncbi:hypothetical protein CROQUDRAFT_87815 [Cronartium quercuum f. sp. fusiforme G11]|uniref:Uncharacterized protein n=1 Tax=Cronartium quercuum f. sp. fusiforme G11 TaxID=708437 RepID=A0A9P6NWB8_9BASI|nr:hypothetical protein CROQUDRAFT_87815 [Cronartium quercuum f. sp. fusiforme G11]
MSQSNSNQDHYRTSTYDSVHRSSGSPSGTSQPQGGSSYFQPKPTHHSSDKTPGIVKQVVKYVQRRVFVCSNRRCGCKPGHITSGHRWPFLTIQRASKENSVPGPETCVPIDVKLEGEVRGLPFVHTTFGRRIRCPAQMVKSYDIYHGPVDYILVRNLTEEQALDLIQALEDCDREAEVFKYLSCHLFVEQELNAIVAGGIAKMSETVDQALLNVKNALGEDTPTADEVLDNAPVTSNTSWTFSLPASIPPRRPH